MTTMELKQTLYKEIESLPDSEEIVKKAIRAIQRLRKQVVKAEQVPLQYTIEELKEGLQESENDFAVGRCYPSGEAFCKIEKEFPWLKK